MQVVGFHPTPHKLAQKSLIKNFTNKFIDLLRALTFALPKPSVRCAGQDDDPHSGGRGIFVPGKEKLLITFHDAFGEIREDDSSLLQTLFN
jgi:hypothetical protein